MRFCLISTQEHWGGGETLLSSISSQLVQSGHSVSWIVRAAGEIEKRISEAQATVLHATKKRGFNLGDWLATSRALRRWHPDVVVLNDSHAVPLAGTASLWCRRPRPVRLACKHTVFPLHSALKYRWLSERLVCVSKAARQVAIQGGLPADHSVVIHGGCERVEPQCHLRQSLRAELGLAEGQLLLVCIGSLLECKGHLELVQAMKQVSINYPQALAVIAGEGEQRPQLEQQIAQAGLQSHVRLLGYRSDACNLIDAADLVIHPSHAEGLSLVLIQAQMLRKPIVATAVGGTQEVLAAGAPECSSWIAEPKNPNSLAEKIQLALAQSQPPDPQQQRRLEASAERMFADFTVQTTTTQIVELASGLMACK